MTFGNAWGHDGLSFNGKDMRQLAKSLVYGNAGVFSGADLAVSAQTTPGNTVRIAAGRAVVDANGPGLTGFYHVWNDGFVNSPAFTATGADPRTDRVILRVVAGVPTVQIVAGTPGPGTPPPPTVTGTDFIVLARVQIPGSTSTITNAMIVDERFSVGQPMTRVLSAALPFLSPSAGDLNYELDTGLLNIWHGGVWRPPLYRAGGSLGIARSSTNQTLVGPSAVDVTGCSVTVNVPYPGRRIRVSAHLYAQGNVAAANYNCEVREGASILGKIGWFRANVAFEASLFEGSIIIDNPSVGSHTYILRMSSTAGSTWSTLNTTDQAWIMVEDIGAI